MNSKYSLSSSVSNATHHQLIEKSGRNRKNDHSASIGCITNWGAHGLLKRGLRRWGSTGSWVCCNTFLEESI